MYNNAGKVLGMRDRRQHFYDISCVKDDKRVGLSDVIQFYSSCHNIGNYTPVLGIQQMLDFQPDTWNIHRVPVDFDFINRHYKCAIIGGAGLLYKVFEPFWREVQRKCKIPLIIWGVGGCFPDGDEQPCVDTSVVRDVFQRSDLINLRDPLTAEYYRTAQAEITACPTILWLEKYIPLRMQKGGTALFASHVDLVPKSEANNIWIKVKNTAKLALYTDNVQRPRKGLMDLIEQDYCKADVVVATRLHGAIIAFGLAITYIGLAWDDKVREFHQQYGNGFLANSIDDIRDLIGKAAASDDRIRIAECEKVREFGVKALAWVQAYVN